MKKYFVVFFLCFLTHFIFGQDKNLRIVSLSGATTEILVGLGLQQQLVGTDITSTYPIAIEKLPKVGHNRNIGAEATLALQPTLIVGTKDAKGTTILKPEVIEQFKAAGVKVVFFTQEYTIEGSKKLINDMAAYFGKKAAGQTLVTQIDQKLRQVTKLSQTPKVLFIYARGVGALSVAGNNTSVAEVISLAGGKNAISDFDNFKPLTTEALIQANPDYLLLFESGLESVGGTEGLLKVPGIAQTNAGKKRKVITMDGSLLTGFSPRVGQAVAELNQKLKQ